MKINARKKKKKLSKSNYLLYYFNISKIRKEKKKKDEVDWYEIPFIENKKIQYADRPFEKGNGIDFYIDCARFLPDNVTVTKLVVKMLNVEL